MTKVDLDKLAEEIHGIAATSGFWDEDRNMGEMLMLIVSELAEALEAHRDKMPLVYKNYLGKPEGVLTELADAAIRILDTLYANWTAGPSMNDSFKAELKSQLKIRGSREQYVIGENFGENLLRITAFVARAEQNIHWLVTALAMIDRLAITLSRDIDLWDAADMKMIYNKTRPYKHGKAY